MAVGAGIVSAGMGIFQGISNADRARKTRRQIENFQRQELKNPYENVRISTLKSDQQTEANNLNVANSVDAIRRTGTRAVIGGIPRINNSSILLQNMISSDLDRQDRERSILIAQGEERIRQIRERREEMALQGLGQQLQTARQDAQSGFTNAISSGLSIASGLSQGGGGSEGGGGNGGSSTMFSDAVDLSDIDFTFGSGANGAFAGAVSGGGF